MLTIYVPEQECWSDDRQEFYTIPKATITMEHSLKAISNWEMRYCKPFYATKKLENEELIYYVKCMTTSASDDTAYLRLTNLNLKEITEYIQKKATASTFSGSNKSKDKEDNSIITSEQIYSYMAYYRIPFTCDEWHIERLMTLIRACGVLNQDHTTKKNFTSSELTDRTRRNAEYKKAHGIPN